MKPIDWTKPIRHTSKGETTVIGKDCDKYVVKIGNQYIAYSPNGSHISVGGRQWIENVPEETVIYVYVTRYKEEKIVSWCWPSMIARVKSDHKNCLLSMQKITLKDGDICGSLPVSIPATGMDF